MTKIAPTYSKYKKSQNLGILKIDQKPSLLKISVIEKLENSNRIVRADNKWTAVNRIKNGYEFSSEVVGTLHGTVTAYRAPESNSGRLGVEISAQTHHFQNLIVPRRKRLNQNSPKSRRIAVLTHFVIASLTTPQQNHLWLGSAKIGIN